MPLSETPALMPPTLDYDTTIIGTLELSENKWVLAVQLSGIKRHTRHILGANGEELAELIQRLKAHCAASGHPIARVILTHEAGRGISNVFPSKSIASIRTVHFSFRANCRAPRRPLRHSL